MTKKLTFIRALVVIALAIGTSAVYGQTAAPQQPVPLKRLTLEQLGDIVVTSMSKQAGEVWQTAAAIYVITQDDIRRSGATTLPDVLRLAPGVIVNQSDANRWAVGIRGFADIFSKSVLVMIDGRSVYTPLVGGVHWAIQDMLLGDVEQIEIIRGPGGTLWGANSVNGVINVITRAAAATQGLRGGIAVGNVEPVIAAARYGGTLGSVGHFRVYAKASKRDAQFHADGRSFDAWHAVQGGFRADWEDVRGGTFTLSGDAYKTQTGERAQVSSYTPPSVADIDGTIDLAGGNVIARWAQKTAAGRSIRLQAYFDHTNRDGFTFGERRETVDGDFNMLLAPVRRHRIAWGVGGRVSPSTITQVVPTLDFVPHDHTDTLASAYVQDDIGIVKNRLTFAAGTKLERNNFTGLEVLPSARVLWTPGAKHSVWAAVTRSVRTPSRFEHDLRLQVFLNPAGPLYLAIDGNPDFDSETVVGSEIGYRKLVSPFFSIDASGFYNSYGRLAGLGDPVVTSETSPIAHFRATLPFENSVEAVTRGFEVAPDWNPRPWWQIKTSYSYLRLTAANLPGYSNTVFRDNYRGQSPHHQVRVFSTLDLPGHLEFDQVYRYVSALEGLNVDAYHSLDVRAGWRPSRRIEISFAGRNLLDAHHAEFNAVPVEIRRSAAVRVALSR